MSLTSLDPRVNRLEIPENWGDMKPLEQPDQLDTYEVFHQRKEGTAFQHVGPVHAANEQIAFLFGKEQYGRRFPCVAMWIARTENVMVSAYTDADTSAYSGTPAGLTLEEGKPEEAYEIFHLKKRGKSHVHMGRVNATSALHALQMARDTFGQEMPCVNVWVIRSADIFQTNPEDKDIWETTPEKKYRDAIAYKVMDKITAYKELHKTQA
jgi:ring-1,2-phenylacetyl-CoA epoxidase subunit PaaB